MTAKHLIIGLDGADLTVVYTLGRQRLPSLFELMDRGVFAHQRSVEPPATLPNWTTFLTGVDPGVHGVFDFTVRDGYRVRFTGGTVRETPTVFSRLDRLGLACACVGFPATYPPERLEHGVFVSGWDSPVAFEADASFVWPRGLHETITRRFGALTFDEVDQFGADAPDWHARLGEKLADKIRRRAELACFLMAMRRWDAFAFYFGESDTASHYLWSLFDEGSPRRPAQVSEQEANGLVRVYEALDRAVASLLAAAGDDVEVTIVSDHGSGGSSDKVVHLNRALEQAGLLRFRKQPSARFGALKKLALERLPPRVRDRVFRFGGALLPSWLESRARFASIDMRHTLAFSDELNYFPAISLNLRGREPCGQVAPHDREATIARVREALLALRDPWTGRSIVSKVQPREAIFRGPHLERAPDLLLELRLDRGYSYNVMPSSLGEPSIVRRLTPAEYLGRKGRSLPGSHRARGLFIAAGPRVHALGKVELSIADASALMLARMDVGQPADAAGGLCAGVLRKATHGVTALPEHEREPTGSERGASRLQARLRALGYVD
jgi:predicted AlkP superfamily phosphohydrolase/phosphomutase